MEENIGLAYQNGIQTITLNRPKVYNSFNRYQALQLQEALDRAEKNQHVRCIVITGAGKAFCAGQDLEEATNPDKMPSFKTLLEEHYKPIVLKIRNIPKPVIAAVNGVAAGAGANIALCCDIVLASDTAVFVQAFSKIGLVPDSGGSYFLPRLVGMQQALALAMTGDKVSATDAQKMGMIYKVYPSDAFIKEVEAIAVKLANMPTCALGLIKKCFNQTFDNNLDEQLALENACQIEASQTSDYKEGVQAFFEKRKPKFTGT